MKPIHALTVACLCLLAGSAHAQRPAFTREGPLEVFTLDDATDAKRWGVAECEMTSDTAHVKLGRASLRFGVPVDWTTGEPQYPVGWPRTDRAAKQDWESDWSGFDFLEFWVYTTSSRAKLPGTPAGLILSGTGKDSWSRTLTELKLNEWVRFAVPLEALTFRNSVKDVKFFISESDYRDKDRVDFYISPLRLVRYAEPVLASFAPAREVIYGGAPGLPLSAKVLGLKEGEGSKLKVSLTSGGRVVRLGTLPVTKGQQRLWLDFGGQALAEGGYTVSASLVGASGPPAVTKLRVVADPWGR